jgi:hypothetical protein
MPGTAITYHVKTQPIIVTGSMEAEFFAAVQSGKMCHYLPSILHGLNLPTFNAYYLI